VFATPAQPLTTVQVSGDSTFTLRLTVTDNLGAQDTADVAMATPAPPAPPVTPPASAPSGGGGGGGSLGWLMIGLLGLAISASRRARSGTG
jgi:hypothetical protein